MRKYGKNDLIKDTHKTIFNLWKKVNDGNYLYISALQPCGRKDTFVIIGRKDYEVASFNAIGCSLLSLRDQLLFPKFRRNVD